MKRLLLYLLILGLGAGVAYLLLSEEPVPDDFPPDVPLPVEHRVQIFFGNSEKDPDMLRCDSVHSVDRIVRAVGDPARAALESLLEGPSPEEEAHGYFTSLNKDVEVKELTVREGVAIVNFDEQLDRGVAGSCRVEAIRAQIERTLLQFPEIKGVRILVEGQEETALQP
jgi:spore germination protein GerM